MDLINWILVAAHALAGVVAAGHALLFKRDPRAALGWIAVCLMFPLAGPILYFLFGVNRVKTRAQRMDRSSRLRIQAGHAGAEDAAGVTVLRRSTPQKFVDLSRVSEAVTHLALTHSNQIVRYHNGEQAYPAMLKAIDQARETLYLTTYIFETNNTGRKFVAALSRAVTRGVDVRVIVDGVGELYSWPLATRLLRESGARVAQFLPPRLVPPSLHVNLRNHRKVLVADGSVVFTGGMNIGDRHLADWPGNRHPVIDIHFGITGPVAEQIEQVFLADWDFVTGEHSATGARETVETENEGAVCRTIVDGPNEDLEKLITILLGAISFARSRIVIMTPYFLPSRELISALQSAALRNVDVRVILPAENNLPFVHWATRNLLWQLLRWGVHVHYQPPPFAHTKLFLVDDHYAQIGSANMDPRSLRLNFELAVEVYDYSFSSELLSYTSDILKKSHEVSMAELDGRSLPIRIRDAAAWLMSPYL